MLQDEAIVLLLVELLGTDGQDMTQGQKPFFFGLLSSLEKSLLTSPHQCLSPVL